MSLENLEKFRQFIWENAARQKELQNFRFQPEFIAAVVEAGKSAGFEFTPAEVQEIMNDNRRLWIERWI